MRTVKRSPPATAAMRIVAASTSDARARCQLTTAMSASDATFTASRAAPAMAERRILGTSGPLIATKTNAGRKMPNVAAIAPGVPAIRYPMKVAVVKTGPGVTWPTATASSSCASVSHPSRCTRSARRNASST
jgi:hypothetical protein